MMYCKTMLGCECIEWQKKNLKYKVQSMKPVKVNGNWQVFFTYVKKNKYCKECPYND